MPEMRVTARGPGENAGHSAVTDKRGMYRMRGIAAGSWTLSTTLAGGGVETNCAARSGQDSECDIVVGTQAPAASGGIIDSATVRDPR